MRTNAPDISAQLRLELDALRDAASGSRGLLDAVLRHSPHGVLVCNRRGELVLRNPAAEKIWGGPVVAGTIAEWSRFRAFHPDGRPFVPEDWSLAKCLTDGELVGPREIEIERFDGERATILCSSAPIFDSSGTPEAALCLFADITESKQERERISLLSDVVAVLSESRDVDHTLRTVAKLSVPRFADGCIIDLFEEGAVRRAAAFHRDPGKVELANEIFRRYPSDLSNPNDPFGQLFHGSGPMLLEEVPDEIFRLWSKDPEQLRMLRELGPRSAILVPIVMHERVNGAISFVHTGSGRQYGAADLATAVHLGRRVGLALDNARLLESERLALEAAREADRRKDEFLAILGHELRNPLAPISTALHLIRLKVTDDIEREVSIIDRQVAHLTRLVDDLLDLSRITRGTVRLTREPVELTLVIAKAIELASPLVEERAHRLRVKVPHGIEIEGDAVRLVQVFANLLSNAARYTDSGGQIDVTATMRDGAVEVVVQDDGIGIAPELLPRLFERFVQGEPGAARARSGLGIGLALVKSLTELHGGSVSCDSEGPGRGSTFRVRLPATSMGLPDRPRRDTPVLNVARSVRVLVVDDLDDVRMTLVEMLRAYGHVVAMASDGPSALQEAARFRPEVAILDIGLPVMDGYELASRLREAAPAVRLIALTGYGLDADREKSRVAGFERHFVKPVRPKEILRAIETPPNA